MIDSGTQTQTIKVDEFPYLIREQAWGQPPASQYILIAVGEKMCGHLISNTYVSSQPGIPTTAPLVWEEPEDAVLVASGMLPQLIAQARQESPSLDWEQDLNDL